jgi:FSR family fosmidomycin resistance protein-like MFS transporter
MAVAIAGLWGWRGAFITLAVPTFVFGVFLYVSLGRLSERRPAERPSEKQPSRGFSSKGSFGSLFAFVFLSSFTHAVTFSTVTFIPLFIIDRFGIDKKTAAAFLSIFYSAGLWASLMGGAFSDRIGRVPVLLGVCFLAGPLIALFSVVGYPFGIGCLLLGLGITLYVRTPVTEAYIVGQTLGSRGSTVLGIYYFANIDGVGILTPVTGFFIDRYGFPAIFTVSGILLVVLTLVCGFLLRGSRLLK